MKADNFCFRWCFKDHKPMCRQDLMANLTVNGNFTFNRSALGQKLDGHLRL